MLLTISGHEGIVYNRLVSVRHSRLVSCKLRLIVTMWCQYYTSAELFIIYIFVTVTLHNTEICMKRMHVITAYICNVHKLRLFLLYKYVVRYTSIVTCLAILLYLGPTVVVVCARYKLYWSNNVYWLNIYVQYNRFTVSREGSTHTHTQQTSIDLPLGWSL